MTTPALTDLLLEARGTASYKLLISDLAKAIVENYAGSSLAGSAQSIQSALDSLNSSFMNLGTRDVYIPSNADLDTYRTPGIYDCNSGSVAVTLEHCPVTTGFRLIVETAGYGSMAYGFQTILLGSGTASSQGGRVYRRALAGATPSTSPWGEWKELPTRSELDDLKASSYRYKGGESCTSNTSLNSYTTPGMYYAVNTTIANSITDKPSAQLFKLVVDTFFGESTNYIYQYFYEYSDDMSVYARRSTNGGSTWSNWKKVSNPG